MPSTARSLIARRPGPAALRVLSRTGVALGVAWTCACTLVTEFDLGRLAETTEVLCSDGLDNDGNRLADCQEFGCLDRNVCCALPKLLLADDFESDPCTGEPCNSRDGLSPVCISPDLWQAWGTPYPVVCEGALAPRKDQACYEIGVLGQVPLLLRPGLRILVGFEGQPERPGRLTVGLTQQQKVSGAAADCADLQPVEHLLSASLTWTLAGAAWTARFDKGDLATSSPVTDAARHQVEIAVGADRRVSYLLDGVEFARSPAELPLPRTPREVRVTLQGRSLSARFTDVRAIDESRCDTPGQWEPASTFQSLSQRTSDTAWDAFEVSYPAVVRRSTGVIELYYTGCPEIGATCDARSLALGLAISRGVGGFERATDTTPLTYVESLLPFTGYGHLDAGVVLTRAGTRYYLSGGQGIYAHQLSADGTRLETLNGGEAVLTPGSTGTWDDATICCASGVEREDGVLMLWYAAQSSADPHPVWRVGLATSADGLAFTRDTRSPVLAEGPVDGFEGQGVTEPEVVYDPIRRLYRMWYGARALFGKSSIGYAVSVDGVTWHKYPQNPVLTTDMVGLDDLGSPAVLADEGELRMWIHGREPGSRRFSIYEVQNLGREVGADP